MPSGSWRRGGGRRRQGVPVGAMLLVVLGGLLLLQTTGVVSWSAWLQLWRFWPVILIAFGASLMLGRRLPWVTTLVVAALLVGSVAGAFALGDRDVGVTVTSLVEPLDGIRSVDATIRFGAGDLTIGSLPADSLSLVEARLETAGEGARTRLNRFGNTAELSISMEGREWFEWFGSSGTQWEVYLSRTPTLSIVLNGGAADMRLDLHHLRAAALEVAVGASDLEVVMPASAGHVDARFDAGAADISVTVPEGVAARITARAGMSSLDIDTRRFPKSGDEYASPDFEDAVNRLDIEFRVGAASVTVR